MSLNEVTVIGTVTRKAEVTTSQRGTVVGKLRVTTVDNWGQDTRSEEHEFVMFGKSATGIEDLKTGTLVLVKGRLSSSSRADKNGKLWPQTSAVAYSVIPLEQANAKPEDEFVCPIGSVVPPVFDNGDDIPF